MGFVALIGMVTSIMASIVAYLFFRADAAAFISQVMIFVTVFVAVISIFSESPRRYRKEDVALAHLMVDWIGLSHSERCRRLAQMKESDADIDERIIAMLEAEHRDLEEAHGDC